MTKRFGDEDPDTYMPEPTTGLLDRPQVVLLVGDLVNGDIDRQKGEMQLLAHDAALRARIEELESESPTYKEICAVNQQTIDTLTAQLATAVGELSTLRQAHSRLVEALNTLLSYFLDPKYDSNEYQNPLVRNSDIRKAQSALAPGGKEE